MNTTIESAKQQVESFVKNYCKISGYRVNPDEKTREDVIEGLAKNKAEKGAQYCPCRPLSGNKEEDKLKICPCKWHKEEISTDGHCYCRLFWGK